MEKAHGHDINPTTHIEYFIIPKNADPTRTHLNRKLVAYPDGIKDRSAAIQRRLEETGLTRKIGNNQLRAIPPTTVSGTRKKWNAWKGENLDEWCTDDMKYFTDTSEKETLVAAHLHGTRKRPHIHVTLVPHRQGRAQTPQTGGTNKEAIPQEADRHRKRLCAERSI